MGRYGKVLIVIGVLCLLGWVPWSKPGATASTVIHSYAKPVSPPDFAVEDLNGNKINFKDPSGDVVLANFWATW